MNGHESSGHGAGRNPATSGNHVIFPMEAEAFVQELTTFSISDIGSNKYDHFMHAYLTSRCNPEFPTVACI